jgi:hypothetical protein
MDNDTRDLLVRIDERTKQTADDVDLLKHVILEGNGTPAITVQVATMNERLKSIEESEKDEKIPRHVTLGIAVSILLAGVAMLAGFMNN